MRRVTQDFLVGRFRKSEKNGYPKAKWIQFCEEMLSRGYSLTLYEARRTVSKYVTVHSGEKQFRVRFSNHKPIKHRELDGDCDFFVGITHTGVRTTDDAIEAVEEYFNANN